MQSITKVIIVLLFSTSLSVAEKGDYLLLASGRVVGQLSSSGTSYIGLNGGINWGPIVGETFFPLFVTYAGYSYDFDVALKYDNASCFKLGNETILPFSLFGYGSIISALFGSWPAIYTELLFYPELSTFGFSGGIGVHSNFIFGIDFSITTVERHTSYGMRIFIDPVRRISAKRS